MRLYCEEDINYEGSSFLNKWLSTGTDVDDLIFYGETEKISEK